MRCESGLLDLADYVSYYIDNRATIFQIFGGLRYVIDVYESSINFKLKRAAVAGSWSKSWNKLPRTGAATTRLRACKYVRRSTAKMRLPIVTSL